MYDVFMNHHRLQARSQGSTKICFVSVSYTSPHSNFLERPRYSTENENKIDVEQNDFAYSYILQNGNTHKSV